MRVFSARRASPARQGYVTLTLIIVLPVLAVAIVFASFWIKLRLEEQWLAEQFGARYDAYRRRTKALFPGVL